MTRPLTSIQRETVTEVAVGAILAVLPKGYRITVGGSGYGLRFEVLPQRPRNQHRCIAMAKHGGRCRNEPGRGMHGLCEAHYNNNQTEDNTND